MQTGTLRTDQDKGIVDQARQQYRLGLAALRNRMIAGQGNDLGLFKNLDFHFGRDFVPVAGLWQVPLVIEVNLAKIAAVPPAPGRKQ